MVTYLCELCGEKCHVLNMIFRHMEKNHDTKKSNVVCDKSDPLIFKYKPKPIEQKENKNNKNDTIVILEELLVRTNVIERMVEDIMETQKQLCVKLFEGVSSSDVEGSSTGNLLPRKHVSPSKKAKRQESEINEDHSDIDTATIFGGVKSFMRSIHRMKLNQELQLEMTTLLALCFAVNKKINKKTLNDMYQRAPEKKFSKKFLKWCAKKFSCALKVYDGGFTEKIYYESPPDQLGNPYVFLLFLKRKVECQLIQNFQNFRSVYQCNKCYQILTTQNSYYKHNSLFCPLSKTKQNKMKRNQKIVESCENGQKRVITLEFAEGRWKMKPTLIDRLTDFLGKELPEIKDENINIKTLPAYLRAILNLDFFCTFDIESTSPSTNLPPDTTNLHFLGRHIPLIITIANASTLEVTGFFIRSHSEVKTVLKDFVLFCLEICEQFKIQKTRALIPIISLIEKRISTTRNGYEKQRIVKLKKLLQEHIDVMPVFGFNSGRYDLKILCNAGLIEMLYEHDLNSDGKNIMPTTIKKMERYLILRSCNLLFTDCLNFEAGAAKLSDLLQQTFPNDPSLHKLHLPYSVLKKGYDCFTYKIPTFEDFEDDMTYCNSLDLEFMEYQKCISEYKMTTNEALKHLKLKNPPQTGKEKYLHIKAYWDNKGFQNFGDILWDYCIADVRPLIKFLQKRIISYYIIGRQYLHGFVSISSFAFYLSFKQVQQNPAELFYIPGEPLYTKIRDAICGGMVLVVCKHVELGVTKIREYKYGKDAKIAKSIYAFDANSQYPSMMVQEMMVGPPLFRCAADNFKADFIHRHKIFPLRFAEYIKVKENAIFMNTLANKGEIRIFMEETNEIYSLDGYGIKWENGIQTPIVVEFMECMGSHGFCYTKYCLNQKHWHEKDKKFINGLTMEENRANTLIRIENLTKIYGTNFKYIWGCEWFYLERNDDLARSIVKYFTIGPPFDPEKIYTEKEIIAEILEGSIDGFIVTSASVRSKSREKFADYPPIVKKAEITYDMLSPIMQSYVKKYNLMSGSKKHTVNVAGFHVESRLFTSEEMRELATKYDTKFYNISEIYQFNMSAVLKPIMEQLYHKRQEAKASGQPSLSLTCKTLMNSIFGKSLQKKSSYKNVQFINLSANDSSKSLTKILCSPHFIEEKQISTNIIEISMRKPKVVFDLPISLAYFILLHSKRQTQNFAHEFIGSYINKRNYQVLMSDTDSIFVCFAESTMDECIPQDLIENYSRDKRKLFHDFLSGWKVEIEVSGHGAFCAPTEKIYGVYRRSSGGEYYRSKFATKGISMTNVNNHSLFDYETLKAITFGTIEPPLTKSTTFRNINAGIVTTEVSKRAMTSLSFKRYLLEDGFNTVPFPSL